jgi:hypothetical protein
MVITPHFRDSGVGTDPDGLCEDLADALQGWMVAAARGTQMLVRAYDAEGSKPVYPQGEAMRNWGTVKDYSAPPELAICLSFYHEHPRPRQRGRLYIPAAWAGAGTNQLKIEAVTREKVGALAQIFADLGGPDVDWGVWSKTDEEFRNTSNWFVDDDWDVIRSRGRKSTARTEGTLDED